MTYERKNDESVVLTFTADEVNQMIEGRAPWAPKENEPSLPSVIQWALSEGEGELDLGLRAVRELEVAAAA